MASRFDSCVLITTSNRPSSHCNSIYDQRPLIPDLSLLHAVTKTANHHENAGKVPARYKFSSERRVL